MIPLSWLRPDRLTGMALPMIMWAVHFVAAYSLAGLGCEQGWQHQPLIGVNLLTASLVLLTVLILVIIIMIGLQAWWLCRNPDTRSETEPRARRARFLSTMTMVLSALAAIAVLFTATPIVMLPPCVG